MPTLDKDSDKEGYQDQQLIMKGQEQIFEQGCEYFVSLMTFKYFIFKMSVNLS